MRRSIPILIAYVLFVAVTSALAGLPSVQERHKAWTTAPQLSPFQAVRWRDAVPEVRVDDRWYELTAVNDIPAEKIVAFTQSIDEKDWQRRFEEDFPAVLILMGHEPGFEVQLAVTDLQTAEIKILPDVPMTAENRRAILEARQSASTRPTTQP
jgi:hypothetical protein